ncbi:MAG: hypothetical protein ACJ713_19085, partial [Candidatus Sulfotelmatobacter sp.]
MSIKRPVLPLPLSFPLRNIEAVSWWDGNGDEQAVNPALYSLTLGTVPVSIDLGGAPDSVRYAVRYRAGNNLPIPEYIR